MSEKVTQYVVFVRKNRKTVLMGYKIESKIYVLFGGGGDYGDDFNLRSLSWINLRGRRTLD